MRDDITVTFFSNFLLHHQTPFCEAMVKLIGSNFHYVATIPIPQERVDMGYQDYRNEPYAINAYECEKKHSEAIKLGENSDVVIIGSAPDEFIKERLKNNKLTFRYCERYFKEGKWRILDPRVFVMHYRKDFIYRKKKLYMLCASAYTASDCRFVFSYPEKTYKWGYFPEFKKHNIADLIKNKSKDIISILWVGRLIKLKHPEAAIEVAEKLKKEGYNFTLDIIGTGEMEQSIRDLICKKGLENYVTMRGAMFPDTVRLYMEKASIFLFTSDHNEGWGAVLNEAMNSACAVVASAEIGSVPYLIQDGTNGLIYDRKHKGELYQKVTTIIKDKFLRDKLQRNAYNTIKNEWNAEVAAERLLHLVDCINNEVKVKYTLGPCSRD